MPRLPEARIPSVSRDLGRWVGRHWKKLGAVLGLTLALFGIASAFQWGCHSEYRQAKVERLEWQHRTNLRERRAYRDGGWGDPPPRGGYYRDGTWDYDCFSKYSHTQCTPVGKASVCVPIYRRWCNYSYYDWPITTFKEIVGEGHETSWQTFGDRLDDTHRETTEGWYVIQFTNTKDRWRYSTRSEDSYRKFIVGDIWELEFPNIGAWHPTKKSSVEAPQ